MSFFSTWLTVLLVLGAIVFVAAYIITIIYHLLKPKKKLKGTSTEYKLTQMKEIK